MPLTKLQKYLSDIFSQIILNSAPFDPDQETYEFLIQAGQTPEAETDQRYIQLIRTLKHDDFNVRSIAAKFLCIICYQNFPLQRKLRNMLPLTILSSNLFVFNLPGFYDPSMLDGIKKSMNSTDGKSKKADVFWFFPKHYITNETLLFTEPMETAVEDMLKLNMDPLYQFIGSFTDPESIKQPWAKPGSLERRLTAKLPGHVKGFTRRHSSAIRRLTMVGKSQDAVIQSSRIVETEESSLKVNRKGSGVSDGSGHESSEKSERRFSNTSAENHQGVLYKPSVSDLDKATPRFQQETRSFWMPDGYAAEGCAKSYRRKTTATVNNQTSNKSISQAETGLPSTSRSTIVDKSRRFRRGESQKTLLDLLELTPQISDSKSIISRRATSYMPEDILPDLNPTEESKIPHHGRSKSSVNQVSERLSTKEFVKQTIKHFCSEMSRETFRLLKQDRHDLYTEYDEQVEKLGLRPFDSKKFQKTSFDPNNILKKKMLVSKPDRKQAFIDFITEGHKEKYAKEQQPVKGEPHKDEYEGIKANTYYGRRWENELSRVRLSNFRKKENFVMFTSPTIIGAAPSKKKDRMAGLHKKRIEKVMDSLKLDVASSNEKFVSNIFGTKELAEQIFGEDFKKYLDVLNYERANYNGSDAEYLEEAYELVDLIYKAKQRSRSDIRPPKRVYDPKNNIGGFTSRKDVFTDEVYLKPAKEVPKSNLHIRQGSEEENPHGHIAGIANIGKMMMLKKKAKTKKKRESSYRRYDNYHPNQNLITETTDLSAPPHTIYETVSSKTAISAVGSRNSIRG